MFRVIPKWKITYRKSTGICAEIFVSNDFYGNVLKTISDVEIHIDVTSITIEKVIPDNQSSIQNK